MLSQCGVDMQRLSRRSTRHIMGRIGFSESLVCLLKVLPALQVEDDAYVCANAHVFLYVLSGNVSQADWDRLQYSLEKSSSTLAMSPNTHDL